MQFVAYYRVSTRSQGESGLGLDAQRHAVRAYAAGKGNIIVEYQEIESGKKDDRPELAKAMAYARKHKAVLAIAKLDRLARDVHFISGLMKSGVEFVACDMPMANKLTIHIMAAMAEHEREMISVRTKSALKILKDKGVRLGNPRIDNARIVANNVRKNLAEQKRANILPIIEAIKASGITTLVGIAGALNARGIKTSRGSQWSATQVSRVLA